MFCKNCGKQVYESSGTCPYCGVNLSHGVAKDMQSYEKKPEKNKNRSVIIVSVVCVLLVIITVAVVAFLMGQNSNENDDSDDDDKKTEEVVEEYDEDTERTTLPYYHTQKVSDTTKNEEPTTRIIRDYERLGSNDLSYVIVSKVDKNSSNKYYVQNENEKKKAWLFLAAINDSFTKDDIVSLSTKGITNQTINEIKNNESYVEIKYNKVQRIRFVGDDIKYDEVVVALSGNYIDTIIFINNGAYSGAYDVEKGELNKKPLSNRVYGADEKY